MPYQEVREISLRSGKCQGKVREDESRKTVATLFYLEKDSVEPTKASNLSADWGFIKALKLTVALIWEKQNSSEAND